MPEALMELGSVTEAIVYRWLFWPDVLEIHGAIIVDLYGAGQEEIERRMSAARSSPRFDNTIEKWARIVDSFNYFEISTLFTRWCGPQDSREDVQLALAATLVPPWRAKIENTFPGTLATAQIAAPDPDLGVCIEVVQGPAFQLPDDFT
ncbi:hypothetical protein DQ392_10840 [Streptomyces reniochalinae]|uniref:Uncharacterized protein n=2 Tax=Streptomyces reniochalinae TaxID=2250578 RepID=A0A367EN39_9ACTN|nr:hypothetical protein DQ392_10840 [Streptomyces reniochalinae]